MAEDVDIWLCFDLYDSLPVLERLRGELDSSLVDIEVRDVSAGSPGAAADSTAPEPAFLLRREGSPPVRVSCDTANVELLVQHLRGAGLPRRRSD